MTTARQTKSKRVRWLRLRLLLVAAGVLVGYLVLVARSLQLQVLEQEVLAAFASKQIDTALEFEPRRGDIYDRNGQELAVSIDMDSL
ncbi:MAG TPA: hypothetical protein VEI04_04635, partial [Syntrophobacteria bacterium]|nr:hypothetical protein [Syntrophobacteria bacterium]